MYAILLLLEEAPPAQRRRLNGPEGTASAGVPGPETFSSPTLKFSRIAHGVPMGGELEYLDGNTVARALNSRTLISYEL